MLVWTLAVGFAEGHPPSVDQEAKQPSPGRTTLLEEVCSDLTATEA